jgi:hypothetical protein
MKPPRIASSGFRRYYREYPNGAACPGLIFVHLCVGWVNKENLDRDWAGLLAAETLLHLDVDATMRLKVAGVMVWDDFRASDVGRWQIGSQAL